MSSKILLLIALFIAHITLTLQQGGGRCTPFNCPITNDPLPNPKEGKPYNLNIGILQYNAGSAMQPSTTYNPNSTLMAKFAAYKLNSDPSFLPDVSVKIYSYVSNSPVTMDAATIALFGTSNISALLVDSDEDGTASIAQLTAAYSAPLFSLSSTTQAFASRRSVMYPTLLRMAPQAKFGTMAIIKILQDLQKNTSIFIYSQDIYGNAAANDFITQAALKNISVFSIGIPTSGNSNTPLIQIQEAVEPNWNVFIIAANLAQSARVLGFMNTTGLIGRNYLYIYTPIFQRSIASVNSVILRPYKSILDGAIAVMPKLAERESNAFSSFTNDWAAADDTYFSGPVPYSGYMAYDAVMTISRAVNTMMQSNPTFPDMFSTLFINVTKKVVFEGLSGDIDFDNNGDRKGDYMILNYREVEVVQVGEFSIVDNSTTMFENFTFWNGSTVVPVLLVRNLTYFCSYLESSDSSDSTGRSTGDFGSDSSSNSSTPIFDNNEGRIITGEIDPKNNSRCICKTGYGGDRCDEKLNLKDIIPAISIAIGVITGLAALVAIFAAVVLGLYWENFRKHGSFYCAVIILGVFMSYMAVLVLLPVPTPALCMLFPWFLGIGFTLVYGCLFIKTWALYKVYRSAEQLKKTSLTPASIIKGIAFYLAFEVLILVIWTIIDRPGVEYKRMMDNTLMLQCSSKHPTFWIIFGALKSVWLVFGALLSVLTRNIAKEYSESKSIAYATYNIIALTVIGIPLAIALGKYPGGLTIIESCVILIAFTFTMCSLFFGVWVRIFHGGQITVPPIPSSYNSSRRGSSQSQTRSSSGSKSSGSPRGSDLTSSSVEMVVRV